MKCSDSDSTVAIFHNHPNNATERKATLSEKDRDTAREEWSFPNPDADRSRIIPARVPIAVGQRQRNAGFHLEPQITYDFFPNSYD